MVRPSKKSRKEYFQDDEIDSDDEILPKVGDDEDDEFNDDDGEDEIDDHDGSDEEDDDDEEEVEGSDDDASDEEGEEEEDGMKGLGDDASDDGVESEYSDDDGILNAEGKGAEIEELEKELMEIQNNEENLLRNLKRHKDEDVLKGQAVKNQKVLWDKALECRFLLQKAFSSSNRLPQEPTRSVFCSSSDSIVDAYSSLISSSKKTLDSILELQEALLEKNPAIDQSMSENSSHIVPSKKTNEEADDDEEWSSISQMQSRMASFRDNSIDKWQRKAQVTSGAAAIKGKLEAFNQKISGQVAAYMRDPTKLIKGMQQNRSAIALFGSIPDSVSNHNQEGVKADGDPELLDDSEFYQQLLKEFLEAVDPTSSETAFYALKRLQTKKRKIVDRRASKSRKIRYHVHEKIKNFMAPETMDLPDMAPRLFSNLFGLKTQRSASGA